MSCLYIFEIKPLTIASLANIFSQSVGFFFKFIVSFAVQKLLSLSRPHLLFLFLFPLFSVLFLTETD